jgi:peptidoglycan biosynthesis protein MviN/MurJ (putative lipid II flippase)
MSTIALLALALWLLPAVLLAVVLVWFFALPQTERPVRRVLRWLRHKLGGRP